MDENETRRAKSLRRRRSHGEGSIRRRADGRWEARLPPQASGGKIKRPSFISRDKRKVVEWLTEQRTAQRHGILVDANRITLAEFVRDHYLPVVRTTLKPRSYVDYQQKLNDYVIPAIGNVPMQKLQPASVEAMFAEMRTAGRRRRGATDTPRGLSATTVNTTRRILRAVLNRAAKHGIVIRNVASLATPPRAERYRATVLTRDQFQTFLDAAVRERLGVGMLVALSMGLRIAEVIGLRWSDIDLDRETLTVNVTLQRVPRSLHDVTAGTKLSLEEPKSERSRRTLRIPVAVAESLKRHKARQGEERLAGGPEWRADERFGKGGEWAGMEFVFTTTTGAPVYDWNLRDAFLRALDAAKLPHMRFHDLRHSCASFLVSRGVHARKVMEQLGHSQIGITMNLYSHVIAGERETADLMDAALVKGASA